MTTTPPPHVFERLALRFDLDVCAPPGGVSWVPADRFYTKRDDGLTKPWWGRVWMNPPYSQTTPWVRRFIAHRHGIALVQHAKSAWHPELWAEAEAVAVPFAYFDFVGGSVPMPVWFAAFGDECVEALHRVGIVRTTTLAALPGARPTQAGNQGHGDTGSGTAATGHTAG